MVEIVDRLAVLVTDNGYGPRKFLIAVVRRKLRKLEQGEGGTLLVRGYRRHEFFGENLWMCLY